MATLHYLQYCIKYLPKSVYKPKFVRNYQLINRPKAHTQLDLVFNEKHRSAQIFRNQSSLALKFSQMVVQFFKKIYTNEVIYCLTQNLSVEKVLIMSLGHSIDLLWQFI